MMDERDSLLGVAIDGYLIEKLIGQGGMARVYRARDVRLGRYVVVKVIKPSARDNDNYRERFEVEAQAIALLGHPHIVQIYRFGEVGDLYYMAMQYIEGMDLSSVLKDYGQDNELLPHTDVLRIVSQVGDALDYAHSKGIIHRDVKPANIMLDMRGDATLTDFGLALLQAKGTLGEIFGTPHYMAPEQAVSSANAVPQSDLYSLGVVLYEMLTGRLPFIGSTALEIALLHMTEQSPAPHDLNPDLHPAFVPILEKALQKEPNNRYLSGSELSAALREAVVSASSAPKPMEATLLHISQHKVPEKVKELRESQQLPDPAAPDLPFVAIGDTPAEVPPVEQPPFLAQRQSNRRGMWISGISAAAAALGIVLIFLAAYFSSASREVSPTATVTAVEQVISNDPTATPLNAIGPTLTPVPPLENLPPTTIPLDSASTEAVAPTQTPVPPTPGAFTASPIVVALRFITNGEDGLYIMNISPAPFYLEFLELRGLQSGGVVGTEWGVATLNNQECVRVVKDDTAAAPDVTCNMVGNLIARDGPNRFWKPEFASFEVYYAGTLIGNCSTAGCILPIPV